MFRSLRTKLTVLYLALFAIALGSVAIAVHSAITTNAASAVRKELVASGAVFDRVWALRTRQLQDAADILARDFGFRQAMATRDDPTMLSALDNLKGRLGLDRAFIVDLEGQFTGLDAGALEEGGAALWAALNTRESAAGVLLIDGAPHQTISARVMSPTLAGWVVFAQRLDARQLAEVERLAAVPLAASIHVRRADGVWRIQGDGLDAGAVAALIDASLQAKGGDPQILKTDQGEAVALAKELDAIDAGAHVALVLSYPLAQALAPYRPLIAVLAAAALAGFVMLGMGSWALARSLTRPLSALESAARKLELGEHAEVRVETNDEIARLAASFNAMAGRIVAREAEVLHLALHDGETSLPNRLGVERRAQEMEAEEGDDLVIAVAVGVERFHYLRGAIGFAATGRLIAELGRRIGERVADGFVGRLSSDTLAVIYRADCLIDGVERAGALRADLQKPIEVDGDLVDVGVTAGVALAGVHAEIITSLIERATIALDQARASRRAIASFDETAYGDPSRNLALMSDMHEAMRDGSMTMFYQPKFDLRAGRVTGVEALARWTHPERGFIPPDVFVEMAEETGHIRTLTEWTLARAIKDQQAMRAAGLDLMVSVNISGRLMDDQDFADRAMARAEEADAKLCFEITETAVIDSPGRALEIIGEFRAAGVAISIDDYGSGLSSLAYLKQIPADELKIDKAFVLSLSEGRRDALLVKSTIDLAHSLGLKVTAEGVETEAAFALLASMGCDLAQGYLIAKPMPRDALLVGFAEGAFDRAAWRTEPRRASGAA